MSTPNEMRKMIGRMRGKPVIKENKPDTPPKEMNVRDMLKITRNVNENLEERTAEVRSDTELSGEELLKARYNTLIGDLEFRKLAKAYENLLKIKTIEFKPSNVLQVALASTRDLIAEYLRNAKNLNVTGEDVQNYFHGMLSRFSNVIAEEVQNKETVFDQSIEEEKFRNFFNDMNVSIKFIDLEVFDDFVFWGGTVDGVIQFVYKVTNDEDTSGVEFNYLEDFSPDNPENEEITGRIESYFDTFYKYWRDNVLEPNADNKEKRQDEPEAVQFKPSDEVSDDAEGDNAPEAETDAPDDTEDEENLEREA